MEAVRQNGWALDFASKELQGDREIVMAAVQRNGGALQIASLELHGMHPNRELAKGSVP